jgi:hypothetical protein
VVQGESPPRLAVGAVRVYFPAMHGAKQEQPLAATAAAGEPVWLVLTALLAGVVILVLPLVGRETSDRGEIARYLLATAAAATALIPAVSRRITALLDRLRSPSAKAKWLIAAILFVLASRYFLLSASLAGRELFPKFHDEFMYLLQARMLARGHLWMPRHELADFFESFYVIVKPVYAAPYFPGTALAYVPGTWLGLAPWATSVIVAGLVVAMTFVAVTELLRDGVLGLLAALLVVSLEQVRGLSVMTMSHPVLMLLALCGMVAWARWRASRAPVWAAVLGAAAGWAAITRPLDALCYFVPLGVALMVDVLRHRSAVPVRPLLVSILVAVAAAAPFLMLQLILDRGATGHWLRTPIAEYGRSNFPGLDFGFHARDVSGGSPSQLPQVRDYYADFFRADLRRHGESSFLPVFLRRLHGTADVCFPSPLLWIVLPVGLIGLRRDPIRWGTWAAALLLPLAYAFYPSYLKHYGVPAAIAFLLLALTGAEVLRRTFPRLSAPLVLFIAVLCVCSLPELSRRPDHFAHAPYLADINAKLSQLDHVPAVVLFKYESKRTDVHEEPVYNIDTAWPDDAPVIRAQDLGERRDREIFDYYAKRQPQRYFYRYNRTTAELTPLGWAKDLAGRP